MSIDDFSHFQKENPILRHYKIVILLVQELEVVLIDVFLSRKHSSFYKKKIMYGPLFFNAKGLLT